MEQYSLFSVPGAWVQDGSLPSEESLAALYVLDTLSGFGPNKFKALFEAGMSPLELLEDPERLPLSGKRGDTLREALRRDAKDAWPKAKTRAQRQLETADKASASILTYGHLSYPSAVFRSNNPVPLLYVLRGAELLTDLRSVACVGSRQIREPYSALHARFAEAAVRTGLAVASGFALGADTIGHEAAVRSGGRTVCVMPCGLDRPFPPENRGFWRSLLDYEGAILVSEFPFGMSASALTLRKRNKLIVAFAGGVMLSQSTASGGAMNAYRFAREQKKPVATFESDGTDDASGNAQIEQQRCEGDATFSRSADEGDFKRWLSTLS